MRLYVGMFSLGLEVKSRVPRNLSFFYPKRSAYLFLTQAAGGAVEQRDERLEDRRALQVYIECLEKHN